MRLPVIRGIIDRRILVNFRIDPEVLADQLPTPFRPKRIHGYGMAGICLIRLRGVRPRFVPELFGVGSENAAHRIAVEWDEWGLTREGVFIPRRDTSSWFNVLVGGRVFPGEHHRARFDVKETGDRYRIAMTARDGAVQLRVDARRAARLPESSIFTSMTEASEFFRRGSLGYSVTSDPHRLDGLELRSARWNVEPLEVTEVTSSYFDDREHFPEGSVAFDSALLMRNIEHEWHGRKSLGCGREIARVPADSGYEGS
jgi:hypothetical protein